MDCRPNNPQATSPGWKQMENSVISGGRNTTSSYLYKRAVQYSMHFNAALSALSDSGFLKYVEILGSVDRLSLKVSKLLELVMKCLKVSQIVEQRMCGSVRAEQPHNEE